MTRTAWRGFIALRDRFRDLVQGLSRDLPSLQSTQQELVNRRGSPVYPVETPVVLNAALEEVTPGTSIKLILVADNPGRREQEAVNRRYLVGPSGKLAEKFFRENPSLGIDFPREVIILNKTPIHTPRTGELAELCRLGGPEIAQAVAESQRAMARMLFDFHRVLGPLPVWIIGYSEMRRGGIFEEYTGTLRECYGDQGTWRNDLFFYRHFSMNQFTIDLRHQMAMGETVAETLDRIGRAYRRRVLGYE